MNKHPLADIIITTRNNTVSLRKTLESVVKQTFLDYQCYVVDDYSKDETIKILKEEFPWVKIVQRNKRSGPAQNRNIAIALGKAPFIVTLDDDVVISPDWLKEMVNFISFSSLIGAVGSQIRFQHLQDTINSIGGFFGVDGCAGDLLFNTPSYKIQSLIERPMRIIFACSAAMIMRRNAFEESGKFDPKYFYPSEDFDLGLRMNLCGYLVIYNPKAIAYHYRHKVVSTFPKYIFSFLSYRNSLLTIFKNFSVYTIIKMLFRFILRHFRPKQLLLFSVCLFWNLFHLGNILKWRKYIRKCRLISEKQILELNLLLSSLRPGKDNYQRKELRSILRRSYLWKIMRRVYHSLHQRFYNSKSNDKHIDTIIFLITNLCNLGCKQCFLHSSLNKDVEKNLTLEEIEKFFTSLGRVKNITLSGGEPFLRKDLSEICIALDKISTPTWITLPTNGAYPDVIFSQTKAILENTRTNLFISLSLDGPSGVHDNIRKSPGLFGKVKETYEKLSFLYYIFYPRLALQVNSTIFVDNHSYFKELYYLVKEQFPLANFTFETIRGKYDTNAVEPISENTYSDLVEFVSGLNDPTMSDQLELHRFTLKTMVERKQVLPCRAGSNIISLDFWGNLCPCEILPPFINIRNIGYEFAHAIKDPQWQRAINDIRKGKCYCSHMCFLDSSLI